MTSSARSNRLPRTAAAVFAAATVFSLAAPSVSAAAPRYAPSADGVWGGYVAQGQGFTNITGSWVEPQVQCNSSNDVFAPWVGVDGYGSQTVEQTGVETNCTNGSPAYRSWYEMYPAQPVYWDDPVAAGDSMTGTVVANGGGNYTITLTDNTSGWTEHTQQHLSSQDVSAEAVIESPSQSYPSFSELDFSGVQVNGQAFDAYNPEAITSGGYGPGPLQDGSFAITPGGFGRHAAPQQVEVGRPTPAGTIRY